MPPESAPAGTVTFLFTDIEGSTKLWESHPESMRVSLARHDALMREAIRNANGTVFKTIGDAFCASFATAPEGLAAALSAQLVLINEPWPEETPIKVRMALHTGAVESRDNDYFGPPVNRVARLLSAAHGGQCLLSQATFELVRDSLPSGVGLKDLGSFQLKDLARPEQVYQLSHPDLRADFPPLRSLSSHPNNLPLQLTSFIGRETEIDRIKALLDTSRLVTLTGAGGSGKTRLGIQIAADLLESFPDGVWLVELAPIPDAESLVRTLANVLNLAEVPETNLTAAIAAHIGKKTQLLILDNCEHLLDSSAIVADTLLKSCPNLRILVTSREALGIPGESAYRVPPLALPDRRAAHSSVSLTQFAAVRLFIDRAVLAEPRFTVTNENAPAVASVCCQLDGIPLAIELAAARVRSMPIEQIEARLDQRFLLLTGGSRIALPRQQTLRALIDWSYDLLEAREKAVLQRLSVFAGGFDLEACEFVCADDQMEGWEVSELVFSLADKSLVVVHESPRGHRYSLLESIREYARDRLSTSGGQGLYFNRHTEYFVALAAAAMPGLRGSSQKEWLQKLDPDNDNFLAVLHRALDTPHGLALTGCLWWYWYFRGRLTEGRAWLTAALTHNPDADPELRARSLNGAGVLAEYQGDFDSALELLHESAEISRSLGDRWALAMALNNVGNVYASKTDFETASTFWGEAHSIFRDMDAEGVLTDLGGLGASLDNLGNVASISGRIDEARDYYQQGLEVRRKAGNLALAAYSLVNLGTLEVQAGNREAALDHYVNGLESSLEFQDNFAVSYFLFGFAALAEAIVATTLLGQCEALREDLGIPLGKLESETQDEILAKARDHLTEEEVDALWEKGRAMSVEEAVQLALQVR